MSIESRAGGRLAAGDQAPDCALAELGEGGAREVRLAELWERGPVVLVFLRHFG